MQKTQAIIKLSEFLNTIQIGDIVLTRNPEGLGKFIKWFQELEGDEAIYTHALLIGKMTLFKNKPENILIYEANGTIDKKPLGQYFDVEMCVIRHKEMTEDTYNIGIIEVLDNIGMRYPYYRLGLIGFDTIINYMLKKVKIKPICKISSLIHFDRPVCSELIAQFLIKAGLRTYFKQKKVCSLQEHFTKKEIWTNVHPDHIHDAALLHKDIYTIVLEGKLVNDTGRITDANIRTEASTASVENG